MLTVLESIKLSTEYLNGKGIESARTNAELLLAEILNCKRLDLYLSFDRPLKDEETDKYREFIARRAKFEPLQYIIGHVEFYGIKLFVDKNVLIPRQETEILVETVIEDSVDKRNLNILDIGVGSGNISISIAKNLEGAVVTGIDISKGALNIAGKNVKLHNLNDSVKLQHADIFNGYSGFTKDKFDVIISNPPYVSEGESITLQKEITEFEPQSAVTDYSDGFKFFKHISESAAEILNENGKIFFEVGISQSGKVAEILKNSGFKNIKIKKDYLDIDRVVYGEI